jgi:hypothetical protein
MEYKRKQLLLARSLHTFYTQLWSAKMKRMFKWDVTAIDSVETFIYL